MPGPFAAGGSAGECTCRPAGALAGVDAPYSPERHLLAYVDARGRVILRRLE